MLQDENPTVRRRRPTGRIVVNYTPFRLEETWAGRTMMGA